MHNYLSVVLTAIATFGVTVILITIFAEPIMGIIQRLKNKKKFEDDTKTICSLFDTTSREVLDVFTDVYFVYFKMFPLNHKTKATGILVKATSSELKELIKFLKDWNFREDETKEFYLNCDCGTDLFKFTKLKKEYYKDEHDNCYIEYFYSGFGKIKKGTAIELNVTKDQCRVLAEQISELLSA